LQLFSLLRPTAACSPTSARLGFIWSTSQYANCWGVSGSRGGNMNDHMGNFEGRRVWIGGVRSNITAPMIKRELNDFGSIEHVETGFQGIAFVTYKDTKSAKDLCEAYADDNRQICGRRVSVKLATTKGYEEAMRRKESYSWGNGKHEAGSGFVGRTPPPPAPPPGTRNGSAAWAGGGGNRVVPERWGLVGAGRQRVPEVSRARPLATSADTKAQRSRSPLRRNGGVTTESRTGGRSARGRGACASQSPLRRERPAGGRSADSGWRSPRPSPSPQQRRAAPDKGRTPSTRHSRSGSPRREGSSKGASGNAGGRQHSASPPGVEGVSPQGGSARSRRAGRSPDGEAASRSVSPRANRHNAGRRESVHSADQNGVGRSADRSTASSGRHNDRSRSASSRTRTSWSRSRSHVPRRVSSGRSASGDSRSSSASSNGGRRTDERQRRRTSKSPRRLPKLPRPPAAVGREQIHQASSMMRKKAAEAAETGGASTSSDAAKVKVEGDVAVALSSPALPEATGSTDTSNASAELSESHALPPGSCNEGGSAGDNCVRADLVAAQEVNSTAVAAAAETAAADARAAKKQQRAQSRERLDCKEVESGGASATAAPCSGHEEPKSAPSILSPPDPPAADADPPTTQPAAVGTAAAPSTVCVEPPTTMLVETGSIDSCSGQDVAICGEVAFAPPAGGERLAEPPAAPAPLHSAGAIDSHTIAVTPEPPSTAAPPRTASTTYSRAMVAVAMDPRHHPMDNSRAIVVAPEATAWALPPPREVIDVALHFMGKRKLVRHLSHTRVGEIADLHPKLHEAAARKTLVVIDDEGFRIGRDLSLGVLARQMGGDGPLELKLEFDEW